MIMAFRIPAINRVKPFRSFLVTLELLVSNRRIAKPNAVKNPERGLSTQKRQCSVAFVDKDLIDLPGRGSNERNSSEDQSNPHQSSNGSRTNIVSSRCGDVETKVTGHWISSSMRRMYLIAGAGSAPKLRAPAVVSLQPGMVS